MSDGGPANPSAIGRTIGSYRVLKELGRGAMGIVYLCDDLRLHRKVALKAVSAPLTGHTQSKERLRREARAAAAVAHPGIATVFAIEEQGDELFVVSEYVRGLTLRHVMASGLVSAPDVLHIATQVAHALTAVHRSGMVHRDLKPENIMWCDDGGVKVLDLGLVRFDSSAAFESIAQLTAEGFIVGTPAYMSPEQLDGHPVDFRTDLFSFGIVLYELATGTHPFLRGSSSAFLSRLMAAEYVPLTFQSKPAVRRFERVVERCLRRDPDDRFESTDALVDMLDSLATGRSGLWKLFGRLGSRRTAPDTRKPSSARRAIGPRAEPVDASAPAESPNVTVASGRYEATAGAAEQSGRQTTPTPDVTRESPGGPPLVPVVSGTDPTSPTAFGRYTVQRSLGAGGFGEVFLGHDTLLDRPVAIKMLRPGSTLLRGEGDPALQEARTLAHLRHPGIVTIHDVGVHAGQMYVVSDYLDGPDLGRWLRDNRPPWREAVRIVAAVAGALSHAHSRLIVHRDVKPANIILTAGVVPVLVDFGLALGEEQAGGRAKGLVSGTPWYMSPEQAEGTAHRIDGRTDVYSLGVVLYEMLTGRVPFRATAIAELIRQVREDEPQPPRQLVRDIPVDLERVCLKALAKRQGDRYTTGEDFAEDLQRVLQAAASPLTPPLAEMSPMPTSMVARADVLSPTPIPALSPSPAAITPSSRRPKREAERRQVTVLACGCDLFASDLFLERLDAEDQACVLRAFQQTCERAVQRLDGVLVECNEHGVLACFGYPIAHEDAARRAATTSFRIVEDLQTISRQLEVGHTIEIKPWIGLHTGPAVVEVNDDVVSLVGEARNIALRLGDIAEPGRIVCSEPTHRLIRGHFACVSRGPQKLKGISQPIEVVSVDGVEGHRNPIEIAAAVGLTPLTARDHELNLLHDRWEQAQEGTGQTVSIVGEPGLGKSRLVHTMVQRVLGQVTSASDLAFGGHASSVGERAAEHSGVVEWRCSSQYQNTGLYPVIDFFERVLAFLPREPAESRLERLVQHLDEYGLAAPEVVPLFASLLSLEHVEHLPTLNLSPFRQREETFVVLREWLRRQARRQPVLFVVEDLHWADATTLEFLGQLVAEDSHECMLTLLTYRPQFRAPWPAVANQTSLALVRLTRRQVGDMMRKKTGNADLHDSVIGYLYDRTGGVPLFVEEFTKVVEAAGTLGEMSDDSRTSAYLAREVPATLHDLILARLGRIDGDLDVVQLAATLGREFTYELIAAASTLDDTTLRTELGKLVEAEILYHKGPPQGGSYIFKHALLEDAAYNSLLKTKRQRFHQRIAEVLESQLPEAVERQPERLAWHLTEAGLTEKAIHSWLKAGLRSRDRSEYNEAIGHLTKGLALLATLAQRPERDTEELQFLSALAPCHIAVRGYAASEVGPILARARELCERAEQAPQLFGTMLGTWEWRLVRGDIRQCVDLAGEGMTLAERLADPGILMEALFMPGVTMFYRAEFAAARGYFERALDSYDDRERAKFWSTFTGHDAGVTHRCYLALALWHLGYADQAMKVDREMRQLAGTIGHAFSTGHALDFTAVLYQFARLGSEVQAAGEEEIAIATDQGFQLWHALGTLHKGAGLLLHGRRDDALLLLHDGLKLFRGTGAELRVPYYLGMLGEAYTQAGRFEEAFAALDEALAIVDKNDDRFHEAELHRLKGELLLVSSADQGVEAEVCFQRAIDIARRQQSKAWELRATMSLARRWQQLDRRADARQALAAVYNTFTEGWTTPDMIDAKTLLQV